MTAIAEATVEKAKAALEANKKAPSTRKPTESYQAVYPTSEAALKEKAVRNGAGPSRAFKLHVPKDLKAGTYFVMAHDKWFVGGQILREACGVTVEELGVEPRSRTPRGAPAITATSLEKMKAEATSMSPEQKKALAEQAKKLLDLLK